MVGIDKFLGLGMMKLSVVFLFVLLSACGGGGGSTSDASPSGSATQPVVSAGAIAGVVTGPTGVPLSGVRLTLSGPSSSSTVSDTNGAYNFSGLASGTYTVTPSASGMTFNPSSISLSVIGAGLSANFAQAVNPTTSLISSYASTLHSTTLAGFETSEESLSNKLAAQGQYRSGTHYKQSGAAFVAASKKFSNDLLAFVLTKAQTSVIDHGAVVAIFEQYKGIDTAYVNSYYNGVNWGLSGSGLANFIADTQTSVAENYVLDMYKLP